jgi:hypothetical protein
MRLRVFERRMKRILRDARVIQMNPAVGIRAKQANLNLQLANLLSFATTIIFR